jgi:predicted O-methyltransferase YrrM
MVLRLPSERAIKVIDGPVDVLHIDGNHDGEKVMWDVINWLPKMAPQGVIILDDINWPSIVPAAKWLAEQSGSYKEFGTWGEYQLK